MNLMEFKQWYNNQYKAYLDDKDVVVAYSNDEKVILLDTKTEKVCTCTIAEVPINTYTAKLSVAYAKLKGYEIPNIIDCAVPVRAIDDEPYYFINLDVQNNFCIGIERNNINDNMRYDKHNYFTKVDRVRKTVDRMKELLKLEYFHSLYCPDYEPNWDDTTEKKYFINYNDITRKYVSTYCYTFGETTSIYFPTEEIAQKVCDELNKEDSE